MSAPHFNGFNAPSKYLGLILKKKREPSVPKNLEEFEG